MKRPNPWMMLTRRLGTPPHGFTLAWSRHAIFNDELIWFSNALWTLFAIGMTSDDEKQLREMVEAHGKVRVANFLLWWADNFGDKATLEQMRMSGFIEHFDGSSALTLETEEDVARILASCGM